MHTVYWLTGLSGSGKTTLSKNLQKELDLEVLDGDILRTGICKGLGFSREDRIENLRRTAHLAKHLAKYNEVLVCCITPYEEARDMAKEIVGSDKFQLIWIKASFEACQERDPKGLYAKQAKGEIKNFTGSTDIFEEPQKADLILETEKETPEESAKKAVDFIQSTSK